MKNRLFLATSIFLLGAVGVLVWRYYGADRPLDRVGTVAIAASSGLPGAPYWIAQEQGLFTKAGLEATVKGYPSGKACAEALLKGEAELASVAELKAAQTAFSDRSKRILGTTAFVHTIKLLGLRDRGIAAVADLKGKRIGVNMGTNGEYFLARLLTLNGLNRGDITWVDIKPQAMLDALAADQVDAVLVWPPYTTRIRGRFGDRLAEFDGQPGQDYYFVVWGDQGWLAQHPRIAERVMLALEWANRWMAAHPEETRTFLAGKYGVAPADLDEDLSNTRFDIGLPQSLLSALEEEARWLAEQGGSFKPVGEPPTNSLDLIAFEPLTAVAPESITMLRGSGSR